MWSYFGQIIGALQCAVGWCKEALPLVPLGDFNGSIAEWISPASRTVEVPLWALVVGTFILWLSGKTLVTVVPILWGSLKAVVRCLGICMSRIHERAGDLYVETADHACSTWACKAPWWMGGCVAEPLGPIKFDDPIAAMQLVVSEGVPKVRAISRGGVVSFLSREEAKDFKMMFDIPTMKEGELGLNEKAIPGSFVEPASGTPPKGFFGLVSNGTVVGLGARVRLPVGDSLVMPMHVVEQARKLEDLRIYNPIARGDNSVVIDSSFFENVVPWTNLDGARMPTPQRVMSRIGVALADLARAQPASATFYVLRGSKLHISCATHIQACPKPYYFLHNASTAHGDSGAMGVDRHRRLCYMHLGGLRNQESNSCLGVSQVYAQSFKDAEMLRAVPFLSQDAETWKEFEVVRSKLDDYEETALDADGSQYEGASALKKQIGEKLSSLLSAHTFGDPAYRLIAPKFKNKAWADMTDDDEDVEQECRNALKLLEEALAPMRRYFVRDYVQVLVRELRKEFVGMTVEQLMCQTFCYHIDIGEIAPDHVLSEVNARLATVPYAELFVDDVGIAAKIEVARLLGQEPNFKVECGRGNGLVLFASVAESPVLTLEEGGVKYPLQEQESWSPREDAMAIPVELEREDGGDFSKLVANGVCVEPTKIVVERRRDHRCLVLSGFLVNGVSRVLTCVVPRLSTEEQERSEKPAKLKTGSEAIQLASDFRKTA